MSFRKIVLLSALTVGLITLLIPLSTRAEVETYMIDKVHSSADWRIRHLFSKVSGTFSDVTGRIWIDRKNLGSSKVEATIDVYSVDTNHQKRDTHLMSSDFFDVEKFAIMTFVSTSVEATGKDTGVIHGELTIHGVTRSVRFPFKVLGFGPDPWGGYRSGFEASTTLKRSDYGINYGLDSQGGGAVGDEVEISLLLEAIKLGPDGAPYRTK
ncbi:MAG: YceI family protein [Deltaproteobacteria bacterium]|nr:MAG: YceI family protein [Deltaproteobacteria bacterium]